MLDSEMDRFMSLGVSSQEPGAVPYVAKQQSPGHPTGALNRFGARRGRRHPPIPAACSPRPHCLRAQTTLGSAAGVGGKTSLHFLTGATGKAEIVSRKPGGYAGEEHPECDVAFVRGSSPPAPLARCCGTPPPLRSSLLAAQPPPVPVVISGAQR